MKNKTCYVINFYFGNRRKRAIHKCGEYLDSIIYGFLRDDWSQTDRVKNKYLGICNNSYKPKNDK